MTAVVKKYYSIFSFQMLILVHQVVKHQVAYVGVTTAAYGSKTSGEYSATMVFAKQPRSTQNVLNRLNGNPLVMARTAKIM